MRCIITYQDTCLSCYVPDHRWIGVYVTNEDTIEDVIGSIESTWAEDGYHDGEPVTDEQIDAFDAAIMRMRRERVLSLCWDETLPPEDPDGEGPQAWFTVTFED